MPNLVEQIGSSLGSLDISADIGGDIGKLISLIQTVAQLIDNPPDEFGDYLNLLSELDLPDFNGSLGLGELFAELDNLIPADLSDVTEGLNNGLSQIDTSMVSTITETVGPAINLIRSLAVLFDGDITCGVFDEIIEHNNPASASEAGEGEGGGGEGSGEGAGGGDSESSPQAAPVITDENIDLAKNVIDSLPSPLTVEALLKWLSDFISARDLPYIVVRSIPVIDDVRDALATVVNWDALDGLNLLSQFAQTLDTTANLLQAAVNGFIENQFDAIRGEISSLDLTAIENHLNSMISAYQTICDAVEAGDISGIGGDITAINNAIGELNTINVSFNADVKVDLLTAKQQLQVLPEQIEDQVVQIISLLQPQASWNNLLGSDTSAPPAVPEAFEPLENLFDHVDQILSQILDAIDLSAVLEPITEPLEEAEAAINLVSQQIVMVTVEVQQRFAEADQAIDALDVESLIAEVENAIGQFITALRQSLSDAFAPVRDVLQVVADGLSTALNEFDAEAVKQAIQDAIDTITAIFDEPAFQEAIEALQELQTIADRLEELEFTPLTDTVIDGIDTIKSALEGIDGDSLGSPLSDMLDSAMAVLPPSITPITDPLLDRMGEIIEDGPVVVLEEIKDVPKEMFDEVRKFDPKSLLGDTLSDPYNELLDTVNSHSPSELLGQVESEFEKLKERLAREVNPGQALQPLTTVFEDLMRSLAQFRPGDILEPIDQAIQEAINTAVDAIPLEDVLNEIEGVTDKIRSYTDIGGRIEELIRHFAGKLEDLADPETQLTAWLDAIFDKIPTASVPTELSDALQALSDAINQTKAMQVEAAFTAQIDLFNQDFGDFNPGEKLTTLVQTGACISRSAVEALPPSANKTALEDLLNNTQLTADNIVGVVNHLAQVKQLSVDVQAQLSVSLQTWDSQYHAVDGVLASFDNAAASVNEIKTWIREAIEAQFVRPVIGVLNKVQPTVQLLVNFADRIADFIAALQTKIDELLAAPDALGDLAESVNNLLENLRNINLDIVQDGINEIFESLREKLNALNPRVFQRILNDSFKEALDTLSFDLILSEDTLQTVDATWNEFIRDLELLDPDTVIVEPLQKVFDEELKPIIDALDISPFLEVIITRLQNLDEDLGEELERVDGAYQQMLAAAPA